MTYVGAPMIWYGDEAGMWGADDPADRKPMLWTDLEPYTDPEDRVDRPLLEHYRRVVALRNTFEALQIGGYRALVADDDAGIFAFERTTPGQRVVVVLNNSDRRQTIRIPVEAADGVSAARPGARRDVLESYVKRVKTMEEIARSFKGVESAYAIQAGRELRIITKSDLVSDLDTYQLAKDISKRIEAEMQYPGHIKVTVIREHRATEYAR